MGAYEKNDGFKHYFFHDDVDYSLDINLSKTEHLIPFCKDRIYQVENEFRLVLYRHPEFTMSDKIEITNISELINKIIIAPFADNAIKEHIRSLITEYGRNKEIIVTSKLSLTPKEIAENLEKYCLADIKS